MRTVLFWGVCIPARLFMAWLGGSKWSMYVRLFTGVIGPRWIIGWANPYSLFHKDTGFFGGPVWWKDERIYHGMLFTTYALSGDAIYLWADAAFGAANWIYSKGPVSVSDATF